MTDTDTEDDTGTVDEDEILRHLMGNFGKQILNMGNTILEDLDGAPNPRGAQPMQGSRFFSALLESCADGEKEEKDFQVDVAVALLPGRLDILKELVQKGLDVNGRHGVPPPLLTAIALNNIEAIKYLLNNGAKLEFDPNCMAGDSFFRLFIEDEDIINKKYRLWSEAYTQYITSGRKLTVVHAGVSANLDTLKFLLNIAPGVELDDGPFSPFHLAVKSGCVEKVKYLADHCVRGRSVNPNVGDGVLTPLHMATMYGNVKMMQFLLSRPKVKTDVTCALLQFTPLHLASVGREVDVIKCLIRHGANITAFAEDWMTPLHVAVMISFNAVRCLVQSGAPIHTTTSKSQESALHRAMVSRKCYGGANESMEIVKYLVQRGADVNARTANGLTALMAQTSVTPASVEILEYLVRVGADVDVKSTKAENTALHLSASFGDFSAIEFLVEAGANPNLPNKAGLRPSHVAAKGGYINCLVSLLQNGADIHALDNFSRTPLDHAIMGLHVDVIEYLLEMGAELNCLHTEPKRKPPLFRAIEADSLKVVKLLVQKGACLEAANEYWDGITPLHFLIDTYSKTQNFDMLRYLVEDAKVPVDTLATGYFGTVLHMACGGDKADLKVVEYLITAGTNVNSLAGVTGREITPLYRTAANGNLIIMKCLVEHGANVNAGGESTSMPLHLAIFYRHLEAVKYLIENGASMTHESSDEDKGYTVNTLLDVALASKDATSSPLHLVKYLIETHGADPEYRDRLGYNLVALAAMRSHWDVVEYLVSDMSQLRLHEAARTGNLETVKEIIDGAFVPIDSRQYIDTTPLQLAARGGHVEVVKYLLERGADVSATNFHASVLHFTVSQDSQEGDGDTECLKLVLEVLKIKFGGEESEAFREHINTGDCEGDTPITWAICNDSLEQTAVFFEHGADPHVKNRKGENGFYWARKSATKESELLTLLGPESIEEDATPNDTNSNAGGSKGLQGREPNSQNVRKPEPEPEQILVGVVGVESEPIIIISTNDDNNNNNNNNSPQLETVTNKRAKQCCSII